MTTATGESVQLFTLDDYKESLPGNDRNMAENVGFPGISIIVSLILIAMGAAVRSSTHENVGIAGMLFLLGGLYLMLSVAMASSVIHDRRQYRRLEMSKRDGNWLLDDISLIEQAYGINDIRDESGHSLREYAQTHRTDGEELVGRFPVTALADDDGSLHHLTMQVEKGGLLRVYEGDGSVQHLLAPGRHAVPHHA